MEFLTMKDLAYQNGGGNGHYYNEDVYKYAEAYANGEYAYPEFYNESSDPNKWQYCGNTDWFRELYKKQASLKCIISMLTGVVKKRLIMPL